MRKLAMIAALMVGALALPSAPAQAAQRSFVIMASAEGTKAQFSYPSSLNVDGIAAGWVSGDRVGYGCAYAFLRSGRHLVGRVTFMRIEYASLNDRFMDEGSRFYDGARSHGSHHQQLNDCPAPREGYEEATGPFGPTPIVTFSDTATGTILEVRDFNTIVQSGDGEPWHFQVEAAGAHRVTIVAYETDEPVLAIYYDRMSSGITVSISS